jgi:hypothetical protein
LIVVSTVDAIRVYFSPQPTGSSKNLVDDVFG